MIFGTKYVESITFGGKRDMEVKCSFINLSGYENFFFVTFHGLLQKNIVKNLYESKK